MRLGEALAIPYIRGAEAVFDAATQAWLRRFEYAELPGCAVESDSAMEGMRALERARVRGILTRVAAGQEVPRPRPPLTGVSVSRQLDALGLAASRDLLEKSLADAAAAPELVALLRTLDGTREDRCRS